MNHKKRAEEALPCGKNCEGRLHVYNCPWRYRNAVESALRQTEIEALEWALEHGDWPLTIPRRIRELKEAKDG